MVDHTRAMMCQLLGFIMLLPRMVLGGLWDGMQPGTVSFRQLGLCASGQPAYFGVIEPAELVQPDKMFVETMGGAICFNRASCNTHELRLWTDVDIFLSESFLRLSPPMIEFLKSGAAVPLHQLSGLVDGGIYFPSSFSAEHPWFGMRGLWAFMCTADIFVGKHNATYEPVYVPGPGPLKTCNEAISGNGANYAGCQNRTNSGMPCLPWPDTPNDYNYCRNRDGGRSRIWCRVSSPLYHDRPDYDYCDAVTETPESTTVYHHGGLNHALLLGAAKQALPNLTLISTYGSSGGGVAATAWASLIADTWTESKVVALADGALHTFPGTSLFDYFWEKAPYGAGPLGQATPQYDVTTPDFDWREVDALAKELKSHEGRVAIAYMSCIDDSVVYSERKRMALFANLTKTLQELVEPGAQHARTWRFLNNLHACSPEGSAFSFIGNCTTHHLLKSYRDLKDLQANISATEFARRVLQGLQPVPGSKATTKFWYENKQPSAEDLVCSSPVRRRRGVAPEADGPGSDTSSTASISPGGNQNLSPGMSSTTSISAGGNESEQEANLACPRAIVSLGGLMALSVAQF
eukprot:TRINITY_DN7583_c0_g1_i7.p1 TRINITY_DN7583_c0_g1~~TRINITY_DN7583_c0_g1_i7.p1  ORF type:complete len:585 (+),score=54.06 TRINITY_DN7583_c0_g1_i7:22-1755(+)